MILLGGRSAIVEFAFDAPLSWLLEFCSFVLGRRTNARLFSICESGRLTSAARNGMIEGIDALQSLSGIVYAIKLCFSLILHGEQTWNDYV